MKSREMSKLTNRLMNYFISSVGNQIAGCAKKSLVHIKNSRFFGLHILLLSCLFCSTHASAQMETDKQDVASAPSERGQVDSNQKERNASATQLKENALSLKAIVSQLPPSWALKVSPDNFLYTTHRDGSLAKYTLSGDLISKVDLQLEDLFNQGQGGLSAIAFHPDFEDQGWIYLSYSYGKDTANGLKVIRIMVKTVNNSSFEVTQKETIFEQLKLRDTAVHYGARLAFMEDTTLLISTGDGFDYREQAQNKSSDMGKILRLTDTGAIPNDNPFASSKTYTQQAVYSLGHRNPQGLIVIKPNMVLAHEHGPAGGDEINIIKAGANYGWPVITQGKDYIGSLITPFTEYKGMQQPTFNWTPSIAPSGMVYYPPSKDTELVSATAVNHIAEFANSLLITSLKFKQLHALSLVGETIKDERIYFANSDYRMRDVTVSSDGRVFILSDGDKGTIFEVVMTH
jgi:glucose/arabinose dehydrogenase